MASVKTVVAAKLLFLRARRSANLASSISPPTFSPSKHVNPDGFRVSEVEAASERTTSKDPFAPASVLYGTPSKRCQERDNSGGQFSAFGKPHCVCQNREVAGLNVLRSSPGRRGSRAIQWPKYLRGARV